MYLFVFQGSQIYVFVELFVMCAWRCLSYICGMFVMCLFDVCPVFVGCLSSVYLIFVIWCFFRCCFAFSVGLFHVLILFNFFSGNYFFLYG